MDFAILIQQNDSNPLNGILLLTGLFLIVFLLFRRKKAKQEAALGMVSSQNPMDSLWVCRNCGWVGDGAPVGTMTRGQKAGTIGGGIALATGTTGAVAGIAGMGVGTTCLLGGLAANVLGALCFATIILAPVGVILEILGLILDVVGIIMLVTGGTATAVGTTAAIGGGAVASRAYLASKTNIQLSACPTCHQQSPIPASSPMGRQFMNENPHVVEQFKDVIASWEQKTI